jgi:hypothetical protein
MKVNPALLVVGGLGVVVTGLCVYVYVTIPEVRTGSNLCLLVQTYVVTLTGIVVAYYTYETSRIRRTAETQIAIAGNQLQFAFEQMEVVRQQTEQARQASEFAAYTRIHELLSNETSRRTRGHLYVGFYQVLAAAVENTLGSGAGHRGVPGVNIRWILDNVQAQSARHEQLSMLLADPAQLDPPYLWHPPVDFLGVAESVLLDLDMIAGPLYRGNRAVEEAARLYRTVIERTAPSLLPFVAVQMRLRGDPSYGTHYRYLLEWLHIDLLGVPNAPRPQAGA